MKIAAIEYYPTSTKGGSEKAFFEVLAGLKKLGHEITVFYVLKGDLLLAYDKLGIGHKQLLNIEFQYFNLNSWFNLIRSSRIVNRSKPDVIYINQLANSVLAAICKLLRKTSITCHIRVPKIGNSRLFNITGKSVNYFICVNHLIKAQYSNYFDTEKLLVVNDGIKIPTGEKLTMPKPIKTYTATFLGRISPEKGLTQLLDTWQILKEKYNLKISLDITGPADSETEMNYKKELIKLIEQKQLSDLVQLKGPISNPLKYFQNYDFSVFPSIVDESFGRTIPESILSGTPVFARNVGIVTDILNPLKEIFVYEKDKELAEKINDFYCSKLNLSLEKLYQHLLQHYDIDKNVIAIETVLKIR